MTEERPSDVLGALPRSRPHRRSEKRAKPASAGRAADSKAPKQAPPTPIRAAGPRRRRRDETLRQPAQPPGTPAPTSTHRRPPPSGTQILGTAVQAVAELAEIGLTASARALRNAVSRLPRP